MRALCCSLALALCLTMMSGPIALASANAMVFVEEWTSTKLSEGYLNKLRVELYDDQTEERIVLVTYDRDDYVLKIKGVYAIETADVNDDGYDDIVAAGEGLWVFDGVSRQLIRNDSAMGDALHGCIANDIMVADLDEDAELELAIAATARAKDADTGIVTVSGRGQYGLCRAILR